VQHGNELARIEREVVHDHRAQLAVAVLLDDEHAVLLDGHHVNALRVRAFPFAQAVEDFIHEHDRVFVVEQNRDGQLRSMIMNDFTLDARKLVPVLHYDGTPITARFIAADIAKKLAQFKVVPFEKAAS
jgi:2-oxoglutarate ferredoxin oxidoreductase subunit alpha